MRLKSLTTETIKIYSILLFIGVVFSCSAPFIHMFYKNTINKPLIELKKEYKAKKIERAEYILKKSKITYFGYTNKRKFWYAIGKPIAMLFFSLILLYASAHIKTKEVKKNIQICFLLCSSTSFYFLIWAFWYRADFPEYLYYIAIGFCSVISSIIIYLISEREKIVRLNKTKAQEESKEFEQKALSFINEMNKTLIN